MKRDFEKELEFYQAKYAEGTCGISDLLAAYDRTLNEYRRVSCEAADALDRASDALAKYRDINKALLNTREQLVKRINQLKERMTCTKGNVYPLNKSSS